METESSREGYSRGDKFTNKDLDYFFANGLYNSNEATDDLIKAIEKAKDEALAKRTLDLYQRHLSTLERPWDHVTFMYGLGLIYMHFNAYNLAVKAFREAIYVQPSFARSRDVHTRLGLIFKAHGRYKLSEKHFNLAINDTRPNSGTCTKLELEFQLAHLFESQGKLKQAKEAYEQLLQQRDLPPQLSANIQRQLGGLYFFNDSDGSTTTTSQSNRQQQSMLNNNHNNIDAFSNVRVDAALNYLNSSYQNDSDPKTSYYLGRCFKDIDKSRDAFASYRSMIDREESTADTWCSIGVLYHRNNQQTDALLAFIRSVQFDKQHATAWMNAGILYEGQNQFQDALKCYQHVIRSNPNGVDHRSLIARIRYIQKQMNEIEASLNSMGSKASKLGSGKLLGLEDVWNLESQTRSKTSIGSGGGGNNNKSINTNTINIDITNASKVATSLTSSCSNMNTSIQAPPKTLPPPSTTTTTKINTDQQNGIIVSNHNNLETKEPNLLNKCANKFENLESSDVNMTTTFTSTETKPANSVYTNSVTESNHVGLLNECKLEKSNQDFKSQSIDSKEFNLNTVLTNGASKDSGISSNSSTSADCALVPSQNLDVTTIANPITAEKVIEECINAPRPRKIDVNLCNNDDEPPELFPTPPPYPLLQPDKLLPSPPSVFLETKKDLTTKRLQEYCQSSSISIVRNFASVLKLDLGLFSTKTLVEISGDQQVEISSHPFYQTGDNHDEQIFNHWACERQRSSSTISRYASYQVATFKESLQEEIETKSNGSKQANSNNNNNNNNNSLTKESETDSNESASAQAAKRLNSNTQSSSINPTTSHQLNHEAQNSAANNHASTNSGYKGPASKKMKKEVATARVKFVRSADRIDLSDDKKWRLQLNELNKLPNFIKCVSASNMLTHCGSIIPGINTTVMGMHVPGCRILGNDTPNNFCSININVGPGDYEWCAVAPEYAGLLTRLCNKNGYELEEKNWWPKMEDLKKYNIPVYRFSQRPGDMIWVNSGTIYWVQALGWCNNIYWNVGPLSAKQYRLASERTEINKLIFYKSDVPMIQLTWNIVININVITDDELYASISDVLRRSLRYCVLVKDLTDESKQTIEFLNDEDPGPTDAKFCSTCECEVFNIYFIKKQDSSISHCVECARRSDPTLAGYNIKQNYELDYLMQLYDKFF